MAIPDPKEPLRRYLQVQRINDSGMRVILERAALDIQRRINRLGSGVGADVRKAQLRLTLNEIRNVQQGMWQHGVLGSITNSQKAAAKAAQDAVEVMDAVLYASVPENVAQVVRDGLGATARAGIERDHARIPRELSQRVYKDFALSSGRVEEVIRSGILSGLSARELASDVYKFISPTVPGGASFSAMRLARTEINNSFHNQQIKGGQRPGVLAVKWNLSGSHPKPDECNHFADQDTDNLGTGLYKPDNVPNKPHPMCLCYLSYKTMDAREFAAALGRGDFDAELDRRIQANLARLGHPTKTVAKSTVSPTARRKAEKLIAKKSAPAKVTSIKKAALAKKTTAPSTKKVKPVSKTLAEHSKSGLKSTRQLGGGSMGKTDLVTFNDGTRAVLKTDRGYARNTKKEAQDGEELASQFGQALGIRVPEVSRVSDDTILMEYIDGETAMERFGLLESNADMLKILESDDGRRMGLFDVVMGNNDRNPGNWLITKDGRLIPIDHGSAFTTFSSPEQAMELVTSLANDPARQLVGQWHNGKIITDGTFNYSQADIEFIRAKFHLMRPQFERLKHVDWYNSALRRLKLLEKYAKGQGRLFS